MASLFESLKKTVQEGAQDIARGVQGKDTGRAGRLDVSFRDAALGMTVTDFGGEGSVSAVTPGGEASRCGVQIGDRVVGVGGRKTESYKEVVEAIRAHPERPLVISLERREKRSETTGPGFVNFRLDEEVDKAERILGLMLSSPHSGPPKHVVRRARGLAFLRVTKVGFAVSGRFGTGLVVARLPPGGGGGGDYQGGGQNTQGGWSAPSAIGTVGASVGFQLGAQIADFLIVLNTDDAVAALSAGGQVSLGGQIGAVAGPVGASREAAVAAQPAAAAPIFTYSISKGLFAGISLEGSVINERNSVNERHYATPGVRASQILSGQIAPTPAASKLLSALAVLDGAQYTAADVLGSSAAPNPVPAEAAATPVAPAAPSAPPAYDESNPFKA